MKNTDTIVSASFRDPSGFLFYRDNVLYRQVNLIYRENYDYLMSTGLLKSLTESELLILHKEVDIPAQNPKVAYKIIKPEKVPFISYPYAWCFTQLRDAALLTLKVQKEALKFGMSLKDCSVYNIQFKKGKPIFIDTLSFERYKEGKPWVAYRQFCQHFLAPLFLMYYLDPRLNRLLQIYMDGIPLDLASKMLPFRTRLNPAIFTHIHLHAKSQDYFADKNLKVDKVRMSRLGFFGLIDSLESMIDKMKWQYKNNEWGDYYNDCNYSDDAFRHKQQLVAEFLNRVNPKSVWDLGGNVGIFSRIASDKGIFTLSFDIDFNAIEKSYSECVKRNDTNLLPLIVDLTTPAPALGWNNQERMSLIERGPADCVFALALVHHLAISNNIPFPKIAEFLANICKSLIIEFVLKSDSQVQRLLLNREDIFSEYTQANFEGCFKDFFNILSTEKIKGSERVLYLMQRK